MNKLSDELLDNSFPNSDVLDKSGIYINTYGQ